MARHERTPRDDSVYRGHKLALWLLGLLALLNGVIGLRSVFDARAVATTADGIPVDSFSPAGAQTVLSLFALLGVDRLFVCLLCVIVLVRLRTLVPLMFALLLAQQLAKRLVVHYLPVATSGPAPGNVVVLVQLSILVAGLLLSQWTPQRKRSATQ
jgi:hypothetical protein